MPSMLYEATLFSIPPGFSSAKQPGPVRGTGPRFAFTAEPSAKKIRIGVVGGGGFGRSFYWHEHTELVSWPPSATCVRTPRSLRKTYGCDKSYESLEKLILDKEIDAVAIFTPAPDPTSATRWPP